jgi:hypothetical protein
VKLSLICLFGGSALGAAICFLFACYDRYGAGKAVRPNTLLNPPIWKKVMSTKAWIFVLCSMALILLAWLPAYLAYFPGICAYDIPTQMWMITDKQYIDHHPLAHTLLLEGFWRLGMDVIGSATTGIGLFACVQMVFLAFSYAVCVRVIAARAKHMGAPLITQLFFMFHPFHWYLSISITKDTIFTAFFVLQMICFYRLLEVMRTEQKASIVKCSLSLVGATVGMMLFRNNGMYAYLVLLVILAVLFAFGGKWRSYFGKVLLISGAAFVVGALSLSLIFRAASGVQGDKREMLSMPIQQLARTMIYHGGVGVLPEDDNTMLEEDKNLVDSFLLNESYRDYRPDISDPVKSNTNTFVVRFRTSEFLTTYLRLFLQYPGEYLNAALAVNAGYLYPEDTSHAYINVTGDDRVGRGYVQTYWESQSVNWYGIYKSSAWSWLRDRLEDWADANAYLNLSILKYLFVPGVWLWFYLLLLARAVMCGRYRACIPYAVVAGYFVTLLLGPTVQLRYIYPMMAAFPLFLFFREAKGEMEPAEENSQGVAVNEKIEEETI